MANISLKVKGMKELADGLKRAPQVGSDAIAYALGRSVLMIESDAKKLAPVNKQTGGGNLRQSIRSSMLSKLKGVVDVGASYAMFVHEGTKPHVIQIRDKLVLVNRRTGQVFGRVVKHPGTRANPFLRSAVEKNEHAVNGLFAAALKKIIKSIAS